MAVPKAAPQTVPDTAMPQLFQAADRASLDGQATYVGRTRLRLLLICAAGIAGAVTGRWGPEQLDVAGVVTSSLFAAALSIEMLMARDRSDKAWYDGRAVAESVKTLAWKFAVCADPFPATMPYHEAVLLLLARMRKVGRQFSDLSLVPVDAPAISSWMREQRAGDLESRKTTYLVGRVCEQRRWYDGKARYNRRRSRRWRGVLMVLELVGVVTSAVSVLAELEVLIGPVLAALAGAVVAWLETKQHDSLARAYSAAVHDLAEIEARLELVRTEEAWAAEVADAEEAISREHTVWLASRSRA